MVEELREGERLGAHRMLARHDRAQHVGAVVEELQAFGGRALHDDADVGRARLHRLDDGAAALLLERDLDRGVGGEKRREVVGKVLRERRGVGVDAHHALHALGIIRDLGAHLADLLEHLARVREEGASRRRELDAPRRPV